MTNFAEAKLAREAEMCFSSLSAVTDYDCWRSSEEEVTVDMVIKNLLHNVENSKMILKKMIKTIPEKRSCPCCSALKDAIVTDRAYVPPKLKKDLKIIIGKYIK